MEGQLSHGGKWESGAGAYVWTPAKQKKEGRKCAQCGTKFQPRKETHQYCRESCKKSAEYERRRMRELVRRQMRLTVAEKESLIVGDHREVDELRNRRTKDMQELIEMYDRGLIHGLIELVEYWKRTAPEVRYLERWTEKPWEDAEIIEHLTQSTYTPAGYVPRDHTWPTPGKARRKPAKLSDDIEIESTP